MEVTRVEQRSYIKIAVLRGKNAMEYHNELVEALGNNALPYRTVSRWVYCVLCCHSFAPARYSATLQRDISERDTVYYRRISGIMRFIEEKPPNFSPWSCDEDI
ncbi:hypothetical protein TNCV_1460511 [Trichonephila clavipes]|nr:hypothetical protein TNCV_1460511 [Trichonephila clavipes]